YCDRERAVLLAELAAKTHPDPEQREAIAAWLKQRATPTIDKFAVAFLQRSMARDANDTQPQMKLHETAIAEILSASIPDLPEITITEVTLVGHAPAPSPSI